MIYCPNPDCNDRENTDELMNCQTCGTTLVINGRYQLLQPLRKISISDGAEVFTVQDLFSTTKVMKILRVGDPKLLELFDREARVLQQLDCHSIPKMESDGYFSFQTAAGLELKCLVMEKIAGVNLEQWLQENHYCPPNLALQWLKQLVDILEYLHQKNLFHRDIKPANIMLKPDGQIALVDFGAVRQITNTVWGEQDLTLVHTPAYAAPEQLKGQAVPQSDFYALGRTFVHLLTGQNPLDFSSGLQWRSSISQCVPTELADLVDKLMNTLVTKRPKNIAIIRRQLQDIEKNKSAHFWQIMIKPRWDLVTLIINICLLAAWLGWWLTWWISNDKSWQLIKPIPPSQTTLLSKTVSTKCSGDIVSAPTPREHSLMEIYRSSNNFNLDRIAANEIFHVQIHSKENYNIQFDLKQTVKWGFDRTIIKNMQTGFYKNISRYPMKSFYIANPKNIGKSKFTVKFCLLK